jgi:fructose-1,6-bisphosphatase II / sedoheptulose-1,7-bisphosphatase
VRKALNTLPIRGVVVIGEGERDKAPMLFIGEEVGQGGAEAVAVDIALDPLEGTTLTAKALPNAMVVIAMGRKGTILHAPDVYMDKIAVGDGYSSGIVDLDCSPQENIQAIAQAKGCSPLEIKVCVLDRPRHKELISKIRDAGAAVCLIADGDIAGVICCALSDKTGVDMYMGQGGAPEGVLAAVALKSMGGQMQGRLLFRNDDEKGRAEKIGIKDLNRKYCLSDMVTGDAIFAATGVTDGSLMRGVRVSENCVETETLLMCSKTGVVQRLLSRQKCRK